MAELANLRIVVDSTSAKTAERDLNSLASTAGNTGRAVDKLIASNERMADAMRSAHKPTLDAVRYLNEMSRELETIGMSSLQIKALEIKMAAAAAPTAELSREIRNMGAELLRAERNAQTITPHIGNVATGSKLAGHHAQNLAFQLQDVGVSLAGGQKPMTVFFQQGSQIAQIAMQAGLGVTGMAKAVLELAGTAAKVVLLNPVFLALAAVVATGMVAFKDFQDQVGKTEELEKFQASLGLTKKEIKELEEAVGPAAITMGDVFKGLGKTIADALNLGPIFDAFKEGFFATFRFVSELASNVAAGIYAAFVGTYQGIIATYKMLPAALGDVLTQAVNGMANGLESFLNGFIASTNAILGKFKLPTIDLVVDIPELQNRYAGAANAAGTAFTGQIKQAFSDAKAGFNAAGDTLSANIIDAAKERMQAGADTIIDERTEKKLSDAAAKAGAKAAAELAKMLNVNLIMKDLEQAFDIKATIKTNIEFDEKEYRKMIDKIDADRERNHAAQQQLIKDNINFAVNGAKNIGAIIGGTFGEGLGQLADSLSKNFPSFAADLGAVFQTLKNDLDKFLGGLGTSIQEIGGAIALGASAAKMTGGSQVGGALGGIAGQAIGKTAGSAIASAVGGQLGKMLGSAAGPLGAIAGGILGGIVGGLFAKTKSASATISAAAGKLDVGGIVGNDSKFKETAKTLAGAVVGGLNKAANALGAEITDAISFSIGQRKEKFIVDMMGLGRTKGAGTMSFETETEAIKYAIDQALRKGILGGLREGTERLLKGFGDVEDRLAKAVDFENVFKAMRANVDPVGIALETLDKRFATLIATFNEAGASAEDFATLEKYYQQERIKAIDEANKAATEKVNSARDALTEAYDRESQAILTTLERFQSLTASLESFRLTLADQLMTAEEIYASARARFEEISTLAVAGNEKAIADLVGVSQRYLDAAQAFLTPEEYNREIQNVMKAVDLAIIQTKTMEDYAQLQLDALENSVDGLITVNDSVLSVRDAIKALADAQALVQAAPPTTLIFQAKAATTLDFGSMTQEEFADYLESLGFVMPRFASGGAHSGGLRLVGENGPELEATGPSRIYNANQTASMLSGGDAAAQVSALRDEMRASLYAIAKNTGRTANQLVRWDGDGLPEPRDY